MNEFEFVFRPSVGEYETRVVKKYEDVDDQLQLETLCREIIMALLGCGFQLDSILEMFFALGHEK